MISETTNTTQSTLSTTERSHLRQIILEASEPIAPFWPMRTMVAQNPIHGLEYLPFDQAVRQGKCLLGGNGYLSNEEYRQLHQEGRISIDCIKRAFTRMGPRSIQQDTCKIGNRHISAHDIWQLHLLFGFEALPPPLLEWELSEDGTTRQFHQSLPEKSRTRILERTIKECELCREYPEKAYLTNLWKSTVATLAQSETASDTQKAHPMHTSLEIQPSILEVSLHDQQAMSDWVGTLTSTDLVEQINSQLIKWVATFLDEGLAGWKMPEREKGFYQAWRQLIGQDYTGTLLGIKNIAKKIHTLPENPEEAICWSLQQLGIPQKQWRGYLSRLLSQLPGWTRYIRWLGEHPTYHAQQQHPIDTTQYLAVRLFYEMELTHVTCEREWGIDGTVSALRAYWKVRPDEYLRKMGNDTHSIHPTKQNICNNAWRLFHLSQFLELSPIEMHDLSSSDANLLLNWLDAFPADNHSTVWLEAYEENFRETLLKKLHAHQGTVPALDIRPLAQLVFCIDVRSESFRRHIEAQGPYETLGFAGFFGIPMSHQAFDSEERADLCPVLLTPNHAVTEVPRPEEHQALQSYASGTRWHQLGHHLFHDLKHNPIGSMMVIDVLGFFFSLGLAGKTLFKKTFHVITSTISNWFSHQVPTQISVSAPSDSQNPKIGDVTAESIPNGFAQGFTLAERATFIENGLRGMGLTQNYGRLVCLCGHGSETENNPYFGALDCGACGGNPGDANARVFAAMANDPEVRTILKEKGLAIPEDTWFLPGKHNTTTDRVIFYDLEEVPQSHREDIYVLCADLEEAEANQALERCHRIPHTPTEITPKEALAHVEDRSWDWANPRPEWGLSGNAAFLIGRRKITRGLDLGGRVFLHSYDPIADPQGAILEKIMTAPLVVGEWINTGYYFSAVDPWGYGSGSKVLHNVVGGVGVMLGSQSDLQMGFPLQTVNNGDRHYHEPMRLQAIIEAKPSVISSIIQKHAILQQLFHNQWLNLIAVDPSTFTYHRYNSNETWETVAATTDDKNSHNE